MSKSILILSLALLFATPSLAYAKDNDRTTSRTQIKELRTEIRDDRQENRSKIAENHANRLEKRFDLYSKRFENIIERFQKRLDLLKTQGMDVSALQSKLDAVKAKLADAKKAGDDAIAAFRAIDPAKWSEQKSELIAARDLANKARDLFKEVHTLLKAALKDLKVLSKSALPASSSAVEHAE